MHLRLSANLVFVSDVDASKSFYRDILGMRLIAERPHYTEYQLEDQTFLVEEKNAIRAPGFDDVRVGGRTGIIFSVSDVRHAVEELRAKGVRIAVEPVEQPWGWNAAFSDADGNEFILEEGS